MNLICFEKLFVYVLGILSSSKPPYFDNLPRTWEFSLVFHVISVKCPWIYGKLKDGCRSTERADKVSWKGDHEWVETLTIARKQNNKTPGNVSLSLLSVFFSLLKDRIPVLDVKLRKVPCFKPGGNDFSMNQAMRPAWPEIPGENTE